MMIKRKPLFYHSLSTTTTDEDTNFTTLTTNTTSSTITSINCLNPTSLKLGRPDYSLSLDRIDRPVINILREVFPESFQGRKFRLQLKKLHRLRLKQPPPSSSMIDEDDTSIIPKPLQTISKLLKQVIRNHKYKVKYQQILFQTCPTTIQYHTHQQVYAFVTRVIQQLLPIGLLGTTSNMKHLNLSIKRLISGTRYEDDELNLWLKNLSLKDIEWLGEKSYHPNQHLKKQTLLKQCLRWLIHQIIFPLLRHNFYITEAQGHHFHCFYYRQDIWYHYQRNFRVTKSYEPKLTTDPSSSYGRVRFIPKLDGTLRPIINFSYRPPLTTNGAKLPSINYKLLPSLQVLKFELLRQPHLNTNGLLGVQELYPILTQYQTQLPTQPPKLYLMKLDLQKCFDSLSRGIILEVLDEVLLDPIYYFSEEPTTLVNVYKVKPVRWRVTTTPPTTIKLSRTKAQIIKLITDHLNHNLFKIDQTFYHQTTGIPQGSTISSYLCSLVLAKLKRDHLSEFIHPPLNLLVNMVDDFLFVTPSYCQALQFIRAMYNGFPDLGCWIHPDKTLTNFPLPTELPLRRWGSRELITYHPSSSNVINSQLFPWCGLLIHTTTLQLVITTNNGSLSDTFTVKLSPNPGQVLRTKFIKLITNKLHYKFITNHRTSLGYLNLHLIYKESFLKLFSYLKKLPTLPSPTYLQVTLDKLLASTWFTIKSHRLHRHPRYTQPTKGGKSTLYSGWPRSHIMKLGYWTLNSILCQLELSSNLKPQLRNWLTTKLPNPLMKVKLVIELHDDTYRLNRKLYQLCRL